MLINGKIFDFILAELLNVEVIILTTVINVSRQSIRIL